MQMNEEGWETKIFIFIVNVPLSLFFRHVLAIFKLKKKLAGGTRL
jgi:hypothetical protein